MHMYMYCTCTLYMYMFSPERFNQTLTRDLAKVIDEDQHNWDEKIGTVLHVMGYWASKQVSTKHSSYYMVYQRDMRLPVDADIHSEEGRNCS